MNFLLIKLRLPYLNHAHKKQLSYPQKFKLYIKGSFCHSPSQHVWHNQFISSTRLGRIVSARRRENFTYTVRMPSQSINNILTQNIQLYHCCTRLILYLPDKQYSSPATIDLRLRQPFLHLIVKMFQKQVPFGELTITHCTFKDLVLHAGLTPTITVPLARKNCCHGICQNHVKTAARLLCLMQYIERFWG